MESPDSLAGGSEVCPQCGGNTQIPSQREGNKTGRHVGGEESGDLPARAGEPSSEWTKIAEELSSDGIQVVETGPMPPSMKPGLSRGKRVDEANLLSRLPRSPW